MKGRVPWALFYLIVNGPFLCKPNASVHCCHISSGTDYVFPESDIFVAALPMFYLLQSLYPFLQYTLSLKEWYECIL